MLLASASACLVKTRITDFFSLPQTEHRVCVCMYIYVCVCVCACVCVCVCVCVCIQYILRNIYLVGVLETDAATKGNAVCNLEEEAALSIRRDDARWVRESEFSGTGLMTPPVLPWPEAPQNSPSITQLHWHHPSTDVSVRD